MECTKLEYLHGENKSSRLGCNRQSHKLHLVKKSTKSIKFKRMRKYIKLIKTICLCLNKNRETQYFGHQF